MMVLMVMMLTMMLVLLTMSNQVINKAIANKYFCIYSCVCIFGDDDNGGAVDNG